MKATNDLHTFLNAAAGEGLELDGVDAANLYASVFPERYKAATQPTASNAGEREAFEAWCLEYHEHLPKWTGSRYRDDVWEDIWAGWQARAALSHPSPPQGWQPIETLPVEDFEYAPGVRAKWSKGWILLGRYDAHGWVEWVGTLEADTWLERDSNRCCGDSEKPTYWYVPPPPPEQGSKG